MGLDIFFHKFTTRSNNIETIIEEENEKAKVVLSEFFKKEFAKLSKLEYGTDEYNTAWSKFYKRLQKHTNYPEFHFSDLMKPLSVDAARPVADRYVESHYAQDDAYFRKVNFVYRFFQDRLEDELCLVEKQDCEELIARCKKVLADHSLASELLPTQSGCFFGSTDYDKWYFEDCKCCIKEMKKLLKGWKDNERCYVYMSW